MSSLKSLTDNFYKNQRLLENQPTIEYVQLANDSSTTVWLMRLWFVVIVLIIVLVTLYFTIYQNPTNKSFHTLGNGQIDGNLTINGDLIYSQPTGPSEPQPIIQSGKFLITATAGTAVYTVVLTTPYTSSTSYFASVNPDLTVPYTTADISSTYPSYKIYNYAANQFRVGISGGTNGTTYGFNFLTYGL